MIAKFLAHKQGIHIHARLFMGETESSLGLCGTLTFREGEWAELLYLLRRECLPSLPAIGKLEIKVEVLE